MSTDCTELRLFLQVASPLRRPEGNASLAMHSIRLSSISVRVAHVTHMLIGYQKQCFLFHLLINYGQRIVRNLDCFCKSLCVKQKTICLRMKYNHPCENIALFRPKTDVPKQVVRLSLLCIIVT